MTAPATNTAESTSTASTTRWRVIRLAPLGRTGLRGLRLADRLERGETKRRGGDDDGGDDDQGKRDWTREEDGEVAAGDLQRRAQRLLHERPQDEREHRGRDRKIQLAQDVAEHT